jgi:hypothetical protein
MHHWMWDTFTPFAASYILRGDHWDEAKEEREKMVRPQTRKGVAVRGHRRDVTRKLEYNPVTEHNAFGA